MAARKPSRAANGARFAGNLRKLREAAGLTQQGLADLAEGLHRTEVSLLERGGREPRLWTLVLLARALGVSVARLLRGVE